MIIVFCGTDGAGKSTQIKLLRSKLNKHLKTQLIWARGGYTPGFSLLKKVARTLLGKSAPSAGESKQRESLLNQSSVSTSWLIIATLDLLFYYAIYLRYLNLRYDIVFCDRYVADTELDFERNYPSTFKPKGFLWGLLKHVVPNPDKQLLLHVPVQISQERSKLKNEPFPDSKETLEFRLSRYLDENRFPSSLYRKLDCTRSISVIHKEIMGDLKLSKK